MKQRKRIPLRSGCLIAAPTGAVPRDRALVGREASFQPLSTLCDVPRDTAAAREKREISFRDHGRGRLRAETQVLGSPRSVRAGAYYISPFGWPVIECFVGGERARMMAEDGADDGCFLQYADGPRLPAAQNQPALVA
jgi:hypothetical protein